MFNIEAENIKQSSSLELQVQHLSVGYHIYGLKYLIDMLQGVQNNAARLVLRARRRDHATLFQSALHWLLSTLTFNIISALLHYSLPSLTLALSIFLILFSYTIPLVHSALLTAESYQSPLHTLQKLLVPAGLPSKAPSTGTALVPNKICHSKYLFSSLLSFLRSPRT